MNIGYKSTLAAAAIALSTGLSSVASAQEHDLKLRVSLSYGSSTSKQTWNTVLLVSGVVLVIGLIQSESTLTILGGAGVLVSLVETSKTGFMPQYSPRGIDLLNRGPVSFGLNPFGMMGPNQGFQNPRPSFYLSANFKF